MLRLFLLFFSATLSAAAPESQTQDLYGTLERDTRKCMSPRCGGYWFTPVNGAGKSLYVSGLTSSDTGKPDVDLNDQDLPRLLLRGHLSPPDWQYQISSLVVETIHEAKGTVPPPATLVFASTYARVPAHNCVVAPCPNILARHLNNGDVREFDRFVFTGFEASYTTPALEKMALSPATIEAGEFEKGTEKFPGGYETIFEVKTLYQRVDENTRP